MSPARLLEAIDRAELIRNLALARVRRMGLLRRLFLGDLAKAPFDVLMGLPEATIVTITETVLVRRGEGASDRDAVIEIEAFRGEASGQWLREVPETYPDYVIARVQLEHADCGMRDAEIAAITRECEYRLLS